MALIYDPNEDLFSAVLDLVQAFYPDGEDTSSHISAWRSWLRLETWYDCVAKAVLFRGCPIRYGVPARLLPTRIVSSIQTELSRLYREYRNRKQLELACALERCMQWEAIDNVKVLLLDPRWEESITAVDRDYSLNSALVQAYPWATKPVIFTQAVEQMLAFEHPVNISVAHPLGAQRLWVPLEQYIGVQNGRNL